MWLPRETNICYPFKALGEVNYFTETFFDATNSVKSGLLMCYYEIPLYSSINAHNSAGGKI